MVSSEGAQDTARSHGVTAAERVAGVLRRRITDGELPPGSQLHEERLTEPLGVSRNTLREAFRLLSHDGLLVHRLHRGVFVAELGAEDLRDLYRLRRALECSAVRSLDLGSPPDLGALHAEVTAATAAAGRGDWPAVGTSNMRFHQGLVGLAGSRRLDEVTRQLLAELRLAFLVVAEPRRLHEPYVRRNRRLLRLLERGELDRAAQELEDYLLESERQLLDAYDASSMLSRARC